MSNITKYLMCFADELGKVEYSILKAVVKTFYKANTELAEYTINNYMNTRFEVRLEDFALEQDTLTREQKEYFYNNINAKQLNFLFELLEKARTSTYDLHAKILAKLYGELLKKGDLNYHEKTFLSAINTLNDDDLFKFYEVLKEKDLDEAQIKNIKFYYPINSYSEHYIFQNLIRTGLFIDSEDFDGGTIRGSSNFQLVDKYFYIHDFTKELFLCLKDILGD